jgi:hypothetical protein
VYARPEKTIIDGKVYFDLQKDAANNEVLVAERARLIQKMRNAKKNGATTQKSEGRYHASFHCDDIVGMNAETH